MLKITAPIYRLIWKVLLWFSKKVDSLLLLSARDALVELPWAPGGGNAIQDKLDEVGLPWRNTTEEIIARFGCSQHPAFHRKQSPIEPCPFGFDGLIYPLTPEPVAFYTPDQVPAAFTAVVWFDYHPVDNLIKVERQLSKFFGRARIYRSGNIYGCDWQAGPARISATVWPHWLQDRPEPNEAHVRDERLISACSITITPGYRRPMSEEEREWLRSFSPFARIEGLLAADTLDKLWANTPQANARDYIRLPPTDQDNFLSQFGFSADGRAMIIASHQLYIVPVEHITGLTLFKLLPAKGPGGAGLSVSYRPPGAALERDRTIGLSNPYGDKDALDDLAARLSERLGCPLTLPEPQYDA